MNDTISRQAALALVATEKPQLLDSDALYMAIDDLPSAQPDASDCWGCNCPKIERVSAQQEQRWIPVMMRLMDSEEREYWEDQFGEKLEDEDAVMFDCPMPEDGQEILISYKKWICIDKCEIAYGGLYGLEGNEDWEGVLAWMPLPEPWKGEEG